MRTLSLRGRLLIVTGVLIAVGLAIADTATYTLLRSSLIGRVDQQLLASKSSAASSLLGRDVHQFPGRGPGEFRGPTAPVTFVELLDPAGNVLTSHTLGFGELAAPPLLPSSLPGSEGASRAVDVLFSTGATTGSQRFRVLATSVDGRGTLIVAFPFDDVQATLRRLLLVEGGVTVAVIAAAVALALWLIRLGLKPLSDIEQTAAAIAGGTLSKRVEPAESQTEVGRLGLALNSMLERIEAAFAERKAAEDRLRRFVADASHELRTPLTSIRGYAELFRRGADERPEDLEKSMRRIEEESLRMATLVDELLLLARLDQGRPLEREPVDLAIIARDAVDDARAVAPSRSIDVETPGALVLTGDDARLRQLLANLINNALVHTEGAIHVRVANNGKHAVLEVADEGPGLAPEDAERVFDRFFRLDPARARDNGGVGLGLSIAQAIAEAHGGGTWVEAREGGGARFIVAIPLETIQIDEGST